MAATIANPEIALIWERTRNQLAQIVAIAGELDESQLNWRPPTAAEAPSNSIFVLATHILGSVREATTETLPGLPSTRDRDAEFRAEGTSIEEIEARWRELQESAPAALAALDAAVLDAPLETRRGPSTGRAWLYNAMEHAAEHRGHCELTRDLLGA